MIIHDQTSKLIVLAVDCYVHDNLITF